MLRFLTWRILGVVAVLVGVATADWLLEGGPGRALRGGAAASPDIDPGAVAPRLIGNAAAIWRWAPPGGLAPVRTVSALLAATALTIFTSRWLARRRRRYVRLQVEVYRTDRADTDAVVRMFDALHKRLLQRWWRRMMLGQPSVSLEVHHACAGPSRAAFLAVSCPAGWESMIEAALQGTYANCRLTRLGTQVARVPAVLRLKKHASFIGRMNALDLRERDWEPPIDRLLTVMAASGEPAFVQIALTPTPAVFEAFARHVYRRQEARLARRRSQRLGARDRSLIEDAELRGALEVQHRALFFADLRVVARNRGACERIASELRVGAAENRLVERGTSLRHGLLGLYTRRVQRGEGNPLPSIDRGVYATVELAALWQLPSVDYAAVPFARGGLPRAPAPPGILRPSGAGTLRDALGPVSIHPRLRKQNTAVPGTVEQGKTSYLVASVAEDVQRERCAVIVLDPKGDAAEATVSVVPSDRRCTVLDFAHPTCGFNPLAVDAPADVIADYVVAALKNLFSDADIRASSDRYLRNAIIAVLAHDRASTLWDAARLLSVGEEGYAYRSSVGARVRTLPAFKEISQFFTAELTAQLADSRSMTTSKLDAPVNKLARLLNSPSIKRVLLNDSLRVDFDEVISGGEILVVKGALGAMGAGNTSVLMQLLVGMLDAALARQQDLVPAEQRTAVALKIDEAPLVLNRGFAETMALKRSAGLETVACWQTDAQWIDRDVREQLDALFAHRVYFATASADDARSAIGLTMAQFSDTIRPGVGRISSLGHPDVRLHLPKHHAIASWSTEAGRQQAFIAQTIPMRVDRERLAIQAAQQRERGGRHLSDLRQPHWDRANTDRTARPLSADGPAAQAPGAAAPIVPETPGSPAPGHVPPAETPAESYRELVELDRAHSVRVARRSSAVAAVRPDALDLEVLSLIATLNHALTSQIHRHLNPGRAASTTQRRLKRLADAGLIERIQFHRRDGGGVPMCCAVTRSGRELLQARDALPQAILANGAEARRMPAVDHDGASARRLRQARHDVHVAGWMLALVHTLGAGVVAIRGPDESVLAPLQRASAGGHTALGPGDLRLSGGRVPHGFLRTDATGARVEPERFETVRPDGAITVSASAGAAESAAPETGVGPPATDIFIERDDRLPDGAGAGKLERYDHFLAGWSAHTARYGRRMQARPLVVFICRDRARARECARRADAVLGACRAYAGEYPFDWDYPGRRSILFAAERDVHEGLLCAYGVPGLPPEVRVAAAHGDPRAGGTSTEHRVISAPVATAGD